MPKFRVTSPDGKTFEVNAPDGATEADALAYAKAQFDKQPPMTMEQPVAVKAGQEIGGVGRQLGLTARYAIEGPAQFAQIATEPIRQLAINPIARQFGSQGIGSLSEGATSLANSLGLPQPEGANERTVGEATKLVAGAGGAGLAGRAAQALPGVLGQVGQFFAANQAQNAMSAAGAGLAGGASKEAGASPTMQALAALGGGIAAPVAGNTVMNAARGAKAFVKNLADYVAPGAVKTQNVDQQISLVLRQQGIDWGAIPERIKQPMRAEVAQALDTGRDLNPDALRRLLDFRTVGASPTRGMLTQDPVQITKEMNLAKTGANSTDLGLQRLPRLQNENTSTLLSALDNAGARNAPDAYTTGGRVLGALNSQAARSRANIDSLYSAARDTSGRSANLDGAAFTTRASGALDEALVGGALPESVSTHLNRIARGEVPFTVDYAEQLKTAIGKLQRASNDGQTRMALGIVRNALDDTPLMAAPKVNPGNLPAVPGTVPPSPSVLGQESIAAFNRARQAHRAFMQRVENTPALQAALDGAEPDQFVRQFITGSGASVRDVGALRRAIGDNPQALEAVKGTIAAHLKSAATNATEDVTKFSPASYNRALNNIGERKLSAFFSPEEIRTLQAVGRVGTLMTAQPAGSAVNNSNSGALILGRALSMLDSVSGKLPLGLDTTIQGVLRGTQQGRALNVPKALTENPEVIPMLQRLGMPAVFGGLLATQPVNQP